MIVRGVMKLPFHDKNIPLTCIYKKFGERNTYPKGEGHFSPGNRVQRKHRDIRLGISNNILRMRDTTPTSWLVTFPPYLKEENDAFEESLIVLIRDKESTLTKLANSCLSIILYLLWYIFYVLRLFMNLIGRIYN